MKKDFPLEFKIERSKRTIKEWYDYWNGKVYVAFSGGKDSAVLLHLVRSIYPEVTAVFCDTGLEYPEIKLLIRSSAIPRYSSSPFISILVLPIVIIAMPTTPISILPVFKGVILSFLNEKWATMAMNRGCEPIIIAANALGTRFSPL